MTHTHPATATTAAPSLLLTQSVTGDERPAEAIRVRWRRGELVRLHRGVYAHAESWIDAPPWVRHAAAVAARAAAHPPSVFCRETALHLHGVQQIWAADRVQVRTGTRGRAGRRQRLSAWPSSAVMQEHLRQLQNRRPARAGRPLTSLPAVPLLEYVLAYSAWSDGSPESTDAARLGEGWPALVRASGGEPLHRLDHRVKTDPLALAVADVICRVPLEQALAVVDSVLSGRTAGGRRLTVAEIHHWVDLIPVRRKRERAQLALELGDAGAESPGESASRAQIWEAGLQLPQLQTEHRLEDGRIGRPDMEWRDVGVIGEFDGIIKYSRAAALSGQSADQVVVQEKRREEALNRSGRRVVRWTWADLKVPGRVPQWLADAGVPRRQP